MKTLIFRIVCFLWAFFFMPFLAFPAKIVDVNFAQYTEVDIMGNLTSPAASMVSDRYGVVHGILTKFGGDGQNLADDTEDLTGGTWSTNGTVDNATTITFTAQNQYIFQNIATSEDNYYLVSFKARLVSGTSGAVRIYTAFSQTGTTIQFSDASVYYWDGTAWNPDTSGDLTSTLTKYYVVLQGKSGGGSIRVGLFESSASVPNTLEFTELQVEDLGTLSTAPGPELFDQETLGSEEVTNGTFDADTDWTKGTGWSIGSGVASCDGSQVAASNFYQSVPSLTAGTLFFISFEVSNRTAGSLTFYLQGWEIESGISADGTYEYYFILPTVAGSWEFQFQANSTFVGSVDNVTVKEVTAPDKGMELTPVTGYGSPWPALAGTEVNTEQDCSSPPGTTEANDTSLWNNTDWNTFESEADPYIGTWSLHLVANGDAQTCVSDQIAVSDNTVYRVSFWYKLAAQDAGTQAEYKIGENGDDDKYVSFTTLDQTSWTEVSHYIYTDGTDIIITVAEDDGAGDNDVDVNIDAVSIRPVQISWEPQGTNTIEIDETEDALLVTYVDTDTGASLALANAADLSSNLTVGHSYTVQVDAKVGAGDTVDIELAQSDDTELYTTDNVDESWTTYTLNFVCTNAATDKIQFDDMGAGDVIYIRNLSIKENTLQAAEPRTYVADNGTIDADWPITDYGLQFDGEGTNLFTYSEDWSQWTAFSCKAPGGSTTGPYGLTTTTAGFVADTTANENRAYYLDVGTQYFVDDDIVAFSCFFKAGVVDWSILEVTRKDNTLTTVYYDLTNVEVESTPTNSEDEGIQSLGNGWVRCWVTLDIKSGATTPRFKVRAAEANGDASFNANEDDVCIYALGAQVEATPYLTSYIPTLNGYPVTRTTMAQSSITGNGLGYSQSSLFQSIVSGASAEGTLIVNGFVPMYNEADVAAASVGILTLTTSAPSILYTNTGVLRTYDGTTFFSTDPNIAQNTNYLLAVYWMVSSGFGLGAVPDGGSWTWNSDTMDANGYTSSGPLRIGYGMEYPFYIDRIRFYDKTFTQDQIESGTYEGIVPKWSGSPWGRSGWADDPWNL